MLECSCYQTAGRSLLASAQPQEQGQEQQQQQQQQADSQAQNATRIVEAGGEDPNSVVTWFNPQHVSISVGETVTWKNPTNVSELHTVSIFSQQDYFANVESPYLIAHGTELTPAIPDEQKTEPLIIPGSK